MEKRATTATASRERSRQRFFASMRCLELRIEADLDAGVVVRRGFVVARVGGSLERMGTVHCDDRPDCYVG